MTKNLVISYDLHEPGKNYEKVSNSIKSLSGHWAKVHLSLWYVRTNLSASEAADRIWRSMDPSDSLFVVDATNNSAAWFNLNSKTSAYLKQSWVLRLAA
jgi:hypothetical protein